MFGLPISSVIEPRMLVAAPPGMSVCEAAKLMREAKVSAVLVVESERLIGIFTERDAVHRVLAPGRDPATTCLGDVMTRNPKCVSPDDPFGYALILMHDNGFRHTPVVEDGHPIGVVSARNALDPDLEEFTAEAARREHYRRRVL